MGMCKCGGLTESKPISNYEVPGTLLGIENVTLVNGVVDEACKECGKGKITIPDIPGLIAAVAITRVKLPFKLNSREIRYFRKALNVTAKEMANYLKVTPETVSRWENEKMPVAEQAEIFLRLIVIALLQSKAEAVDPEMDAVAKMNVQAVFDRSALAKMMHFVRVLKDRKTEAVPLWRDERKVANG